MDYRILGPLEVRDGDRLVAVGGDKQRALLAILLLHRNEVVSTDRLIHHLWGESPPVSALRTLQAYVSRLRRALDTNHDSPSRVGGAVPGSDHRVLLTRGRGYVLDLSPGELDLDRFLQLAERGRDALVAGRPEEAARLLREALALWRGPALSDFTYEPFAQAAIAQLEELQVSVLEDRVEADLALGRARELVAELRELVARHPLRERLRSQLMLALYRCGRQAEALEGYQSLRHALADQLGLEPSPGLAQLELAILSRDPTLDLPPGTTGSHIQAESLARPRGVAALTHPRRLALAVCGPVLIALLLAAAVIGSSGGRSTLVPGDSVGAISSAGGGVSAVVPLGTSPSALAAGHGAVWVADYNEGTVSRIDSATRAVVQTIQVGSTPSGVAVGAGAVWITNNYSQTVSRVDPSVDRVVQTIAVGNAPTGVTVGDGSVWVANSSDGTLTRIDAVTGAVSDTIALGGTPTDVAAGDGAVWVSDETGGRVVRVDPQSDQVVATINVGTGPTAVVGGFGSMWVANSLDGTVSRIDPATNTVVATIPVGNGAGAAAVGEGAVWVASPYAGTVSHIDPATDAVVQRLTVGSRPQGLAIIGGLVWVGARADATSNRGGTLNAITQGSADTFDPVLTQNLGALLPLTNDGLTAYQRVGGAVRSK